MKVISLSTPYARWFLVTCLDNGALLKRTVEQWAVVQFEQYRDPTESYQKGQAVVPVVMGPAGLECIIEPIGTPTSPHLGFEEVIPENVSEPSWDEAKTRYLKTKAGN